MTLGDDGRPPRRTRRLRRRFFSSRRYLGARRPHFDGRKFVNEVPTESWARRVARWMATRRPAPWPKWIPDAPGPAPAPRVDGTEIRITVVGHATVLIQTAGLNLLTDPVWSRRVGPFPWLGPARVRPPGVRFDDLPRIDCVLLSHDHYDHLDVPTLRRLVARDRPRLLCGLGVERTLEIDGLRGAEAMDWHEARRLGDGVDCVFTPSRHFSGRGLKDQDSTLWGSFLVRTPSGTVYFGGDTGFGPHFAETRARYGAPTIALLPIGCYEPRWFMRPYHMSPADAVQALLALGAGTGIGIHFGTYKLGDEAIDRPQIDLAEALRAKGLASSALIVPRFGEPLVPGAPRQIAGARASASQLEVVLAADSC